MKPKSLIVLQSLFDGLDITINNYKYRLVDLENGQKFLAMIMWNETKNIEHLVGSDHMTLSNFINECDKLKDDEIFIIAANSVLNQTHRRKL